MKERKVEFERLRQTAFMGTGIDCSEIFRKIRFLQEFFSSPIVCISDSYSLLSKAS